MCRYVNVLMRIPEQVKSISAKQTTGSYPNVHSTTLVRIIVNISKIEHHSADGFSFPHFHIGTFTHCLGFQLHHKQVLSSQCQ